MRRARIIVGSPGRIGLVGELLATPIVFQFEAFCYFHFDAERGSSLASGRRSCRMRVPRFAAHVVAIVVIAVLVTPVVAQEWPSSTVRVVVPYAAGGPVDVPARLLIERLAAQTKGVFILENRPGAGGSIGLQAVVQAAPDGGTLLLTTSSVTMVPTIYPKLAFDPLRDLTSISLVTEVPISLAVRAASPFRDLADLITRAKAEPGKYTFGSGGVGTGNHLAGELLKKLAGIDLLHVPFRGVAPALTALYAGDIDTLFASTVETVSHARDRRIRVLGVGSPQPIPELPDSPAIGDLVPGYVATNWYGLFGPRGLPAGVLTRLQTELPKAGADAALKEKAAALGMTMMLLPADALRARIEAEVPRWKQIIPDIGLKVE
jgi:tripartite-type tricarboxylate transporter receptor subunit TctC